jgi:hypothetical protein
LAAKLDHPNRLKRLLLDQTPLSKQAVNEIIKCAAYVDEIARGDICDATFLPQKIYEDISYIIESGMVAELYTDYTIDIRDFNLIPTDLEKIIIGELILSIFENYADMVACPDAAKLVYSDKLEKLLKRK